MHSDELVVMGYVRGAFGVQGWLKVHADTEYADSLFDYPVWWFAKPGAQATWVAHSVEDCALHTKALVAKLAGVNDRDQADALRGFQIAVARHELPPPAEDEYYWRDLIGLAVVNLAEESLGQVVRLMETGAHDILVARDAERERLIPFVQRYIIRVDLPAKRIVVDWELDY